MTRFTAEWENGISYHDTKESAEMAAINASKETGLCEWILVAEQEYRRHGWVDIRRWTGDWDGLHDETFSEATA